MNFYNKDNFILLSQGYSEVVAPGAGGSDPAVGHAIIDTARRARDFRSRSANLKNNNKVQ